MCNCCYLLHALVVLALDMNSDLPCIHMLTRHITNPLHCTTLHLQIVRATVAFRKDQRQEAQRLAKLAKSAVNKEKSLRRSASAAAAAAAHSEDSSVSSANARTTSSSSRRKSKVTSLLTNLSGSDRSAPNSATSNSGAAAAAAGGRSTFGKEHALELEMSNNSTAANGSQAQFESGDAPTATG
jgi:sensor c-di-GMP phosphodiesterase-like protein